MFSSASALVMSGGIWNFMFKVSVSVQGFTRCLEVPPFGPWAIIRVSAVGLVVPAVSSLVSALAVPAELEYRECPVFNLSRLVL